MSSNYKKIHWRYNLWPHYSCSMLYSHILTTWCIRLPTDRFPFSSVRISQGRWMMLSLLLLVKEQCFKWSKSYTAIPRRPNIHNKRMEDNGTTTLKRIRETFLRHWSLKPSSSITTPSLVTCIECNMKKNYCYLAAPFQPGTSYPIHYNEPIFSPLRNAGIVRQSTSYQTILQVWAM